MTRRRTKILAFTLLGTLGLLGVLRLFLDRIVWSQTAAVLRDTYGLEASLKDLSISLLSGRATLRELRITEGGAPLFRAEELLVSVSIRKILAGDFDFEKILVTRPVFRLALEQDGGTNIGRIFKSDAPADGPAPTGGPAPRVFFEEARVIDGRFDLDDAQADEQQPTKLVLEHIEGIGTPSPCP